MLRVGIIGCGLIGKKRAQAILKCDDHVIQCFDPSTTAAEELVTSTQCSKVACWEEITSNPKIDAVVIATPNHLHAPIAIQALQSDKHVLCEKPLARSANEAAQMVLAAKQKQRVLKTGFNHRHFQGVLAAQEAVTMGKIGTPMFIRARYGHGGRPGYDEEWRGNIETSGGGELLDQGVHIIDLCRWFMGNFTEAFGVLSNSFWKKTPLEDNAFVTLRGKGGVVAQFHTSWTQWKNLFSFEIFGSQGYILIEGLTGSYGNQRMCIGIRDDTKWRPQEEWREFPTEDTSWELEWKELKTAIEKNKTPLGSGVDGYATSVIVDTIYQSVRTGKPETIIYNNQVLEDSIR